MGEMVKLEVPPSWRSACCGRKSCTTTVPSLWTCPWAHGGSPWWGKWISIRWQISSGRKSTLDWKTGENLSKNLPLAEFSPHKFTMISRFCMWNAPSKARLQSQPWHRGCQKMSVGSEVYQPVRTWAKMPKMLGNEVLRHPLPPARTRANNRYPKPEESLEGILAPNTSETTPARKTQLSRLHHGNLMFLKKSCFGNS